VREAKEQERERKGESNGQEENLDQVSKGESRENE